MKLRGLDILPYRAWKLAYIFEQEINKPYNIRGLDPYRPCMVVCLKKEMGYDRLRLVAQTALMRLMSTALCLTVSRSWKLYSDALLCRAVYFFSF